jgi:hypothetical protein
MLSRINSVDDMMTPDFHALLVSIAKKVQTTNMMLEGELSKIRAAAPVAKRVPHSERVCYLSLLSFLMSDHLAAGNRDSRGQDSRKELLEQGVPLEKRPDKQTCRYCKGMTCGFVVSSRLHNARIEH